MKLTSIKLIFHWSNSSVQTQQRLDDKKINKDLPIINVENYTKKFGKFTANKNVSFKVGHGIIHGFIGPNGSGKTTTIKTLVGAYTLEDGKIEINGKRPGTREANSIIGYIPERASFPAHLNCIDYLKSMGELSGLKRKDALVKAREILKDLGMESYAKRKPTKFSSGMQKKILLAQSLMNDPSLLIFDEPSANLDPTARKELQDDLIRLRNQGKTILISSHILSELERIIDEVTFLFYGEVLFSGKIAEFDSHTKGVFIKTNNNLHAQRILTEANLVVTGDIKTEIFVECDSLEKTKYVNMILLNDPQILIKSLRANDLQTVYDELLEQAVSTNRGNQKIGDKKVTAFKAKGDEEKNASVL